MRHVAALRTTSAEAGVLMGSGSSSVVGRSAEAAFASGLYCAESVLLAMARAQGIESDVLPGIATGFCSGVSRTGGMCGALSGAIMGIGLALGRREVGPADACYDATQRLIGEFEQRFGSRDCHELLGCDLATEEGRATFRDGGLMKRCAELTRVAAEMGARQVESHG